MMPYNLNIVMEWCQMPKNNPFEKFAVKELALQKSTFEYMSFQYANKLMFHHSPNEHNKSTPFARWIASVTGVSNGFPDWIIASHLTGQQLIVELKHGNNVPEPEQIKWLETFESGGHFSFVVWTFEAFKMLVDAYYDYTTRRGVANSKWTDFVIRHVKNVYFDDTHVSYSIIDFDNVPKKILKIAI